VLESRGAFLRDGYFVDFGDKGLLSVFMRVSCFLQDFRVSLKAAAPTSSLGTFDAAVASFFLAAAMGATGLRGGGLMLVRLMFMLLLSLGSLFLEFVLTVGLMKLPVLCFGAWLVFATILE